MKNLTQTQLQKYFAWLDEAFRGGAYCPTLPNGLRTVFVNDQYLTKSVALEVYKFWYKNFQG